MRTPSSSISFVEIINATQTLLWLAIRQAELFLFRSLQQLADRSDSSPADQLKTIFPLLTCAILFLPKSAETIEDHVVRRKKWHL
jgi:hypothetical protein